MHIYISFGMPQEDKYFIFSAKALRIAFAETVTDAFEASLVAQVVKNKLINRIQTKKK